MNTYYFILTSPSGNIPVLVKRCKTEDKHRAALFFIEKLQGIIKHELFTFPELFEHIKEKSELSTQEEAWIKKEDAILMDL